MNLRCSTCRELKPPEAFAFDSDRSAIRLTRCRTCGRAAQIAVAKRKKLPQRRPPAISLLGLFIGGI